MIHVRTAKGNRHPLLTVCMCAGNVGLPPGLGPPPGLSAHALKATTPELSSGSSTSSSGHTTASNVVQPVPHTAGAKFNWAEEVENQSMYGAASYGGSSLAGAAPASTRAASRSSYVTSPDVLDEEDDEDDDDLPKGASVARAMRGLNFGSSGPVASSLVRAPIGAPDVDEEPPENLWADANEPKTQILPWRGNCPEHGPVCPKGICKVAKAMKKQKEREDAIARGEVPARGGAAGRGKSRDKKQKPSERDDWIRPEVRAQDSTHSSSGRSSGPSPAPNHSAASGNAAPAAATRPSRSAGATGWDNQASDAWSDWGAGDDDSKSVASSARTAWGHSGKQDDDTRSVASAATARTQSTSGWGNVNASAMPWGNAAPATSNASARGGHKEDDDARSVASAATQRTQSTSGWGGVNVAAMPWGRAPSATARGGNGQDDDARSVASAATARTQSTTGWSSVDVSAMPWGNAGLSANNTSARGARGGARGARGARGGDRGGRGGGDRGGRGGSVQSAGRPTTSQSQPVKPQAATWAIPPGEDDWGTPAQATEAW
ncbi:hypothetical protein PENSPDRAFT_201992 [Peniophora sp. CONT]|nr:hypothetical protein PENSPDRAFT_201992 [Peniophora sp. CONT]